MKGEFCQEEPRICGGLKSTRLRTQRLTDRADAWPGSGLTACAGAGVGPGGRDIQRGTYICVS